MPSSTDSVTVAATVSAMNGSGSMNPRPTASKTQIDR